MPNVTIKQIEELQFYQGPHMKEGIRFRYAGKDLGVTAWGMNVIELAPHCAAYPEHDHLSDGQEEVYVVLRGVARMRAAGQEVRLQAGALVRVAPSEKRCFFTDAEGATLLAIGATPGSAYVPAR
jgi:uncharacterized cupin superfamily protein